MATINIFLKCILHILIDIYRYTADSNGYKAEVSYIEGQQESIQSAVPVAATPVSPLVTAQPIYDYYRNVQSQNQDYAEPYQNVQYQQHQPTAATYYSNTAAPQYNNHVNVDNVRINTYNSGPFQSSGHIVSTAIAPHQTASIAVLTPTHETVYATPSTPAYSSSVYILPSPKNTAYSTHEPSYVNGNGNYDYYVDYEYKSTHPPPKGSPSTVLNTNALFYKS